MIILKHPDVIYISSFGREEKINKMIWVTGLGKNETRFYTFLRLLSNRLCSVPFFFSWWSFYFTNCLPSIIFSGLPIFHCLSSPCHLPLWVDPLFTRNLKNIHFQVTFIPDLLTELHYNVSHYSWCLQFKLTSVNINPQPYWILCWTGDFKMNKA